MTRAVRVGTTVVTLLALASLIAVAPDVVPKALADKHKGCNVELLEGTFGYSGQSLVLFPPPPIPPTAPSPIGAYVPFSVVGTISLDGDGNLQGADVVNLGFGGIPRTYTGTYEVVDPTATPSNCEFTATFTALSSLPPLTENLHMVLARDGQVLEMMNTNPGFVVAFAGEKK